jgi:hypothetical protein
VVTLAGGSVATLGPVEVLLDDGRLLLDVVSLGVLDREAEVVKDGVDESDNGKTDYLSAYISEQKSENIHRAQARPEIAITRPHSL